MFKGKALFVDVMLTLGGVTFMVLAGAALFSFPHSLLDTPQLEPVELRGIGIATVCLILAGYSLFLRERLADKHRRQASSLKDLTNF